MPIPHSKHQMHGLTTETERLVVCLVLGECWPHEDSYELLKA